ncbi:MAG: ribosome small subunit-dependent GTPase A [Oscillatoriales cyanobacterium SM2_2_1]|nr:ribosome small subunit-dependent GTPase A [Oscillatoriales cyanobacterium SM2_2_1]
MAVQANFYRVRLELPDQPELLCVRRARLKKVGVQIVVGDRVVVEEPDWQGNRGAIAEVLPRRNQLERPAISNVDRLLLVSSLAQPEPDPHQVSRFLAMAAPLGCAVLVVWTKRDLVGERTVTFWGDRLHQWGYPSLAVSTVTGQGLEELRGQLRSGISIVTGLSGVGKSSLIQVLAPREQLRTGRISTRHEKGRHTTRHVELFPLPEGGHLADSPGFMQPALTMTVRQLMAAFPEIQFRLEQDSCQFPDCTHRHEPGCVVRGDWERYPHYLNFLAEVQEHGDRLHSTRTTDRAYKDKSQHHEPLLNRKKHRRPSRRVLHQGQDAGNGSDIEVGEVEL